MRKTKVRIVGDPSLAEKVAGVILNHFETEGKPDKYDKAVGRDYAHSKAPGCSIYITIKKERSIHDTP